MVTLNDARNVIAAAEKKAIEIRQPIHGPRLLGATRISERVFWRSRSWRVFGGGKKHG